MNRSQLVFSLSVLTLLIAVFAFIPAQAQMGQGGQVHQRMQCDDSFKVMDTSGDMKVSKEEFMSGSHRGVGNGALNDSFQAVDTNSDGTLSKDEFCAGAGMKKDAGKSQ